MYNQNMAKTHRLQIRLSEEEFLTLQAEADRKDESMAEVVRQYIHRLPKPQSRLSAIFKEAKR